MCLCFEQMVNSLQHQPPAQLATEPTVNHGTPPPPADPVVRKQVVQDLMAQMQGTYNFMQVKRSSIYCRVQLGAVTKGPDTPTEGQKLVPTNADCGVASCRPTAPFVLAKN